MIVYQATKQDFSTHVLSGEIEQVILRRFQEKLQRTTSPKEIEAWRNWGNRPGFTWSYIGKTNLNLIGFRILPIP
jgi:hypothetical protein